MCSVSPPLSAGDPLRQSANFKERSDETDRETEWQEWKAGWWDCAVKMGCQCACVCVHACESVCCFVILTGMQRRLRLPLLLVSRAAALTSSSSMRPCPERTALPDCSWPVTRRLRLTMFLEPLPFCSSSFLWCQYNRLVLLSIPWDS